MRAAEERCLGQGDQRTTPPGLLVLARSHQRRRLRPLHPEPERAHPGGTPTPLRLLSGQGIWLDAMLHLMHECDEPICVHAAADDSSHLSPGTHRENMLDRIKKRRDSNGSGLRYWGMGRAAQAARSRRLRDELMAHGWNDERIAAIRFGHEPDAPTLF